MRTWIACIVVAALVTSTWALPAWADGVELIEKGQAAGTVPLESQRE
jgi:hypothetical protein